MDELVEFLAGKPDCFPKYWDFHLPNYPSEGSLEPRPDYA
jgi:hypothetical protein